MENRVPPFPPPLDPPRLPSSSDFVHTNRRSSYPSPTVPSPGGYHPRPIQHDRYVGYPSPGIGSSNSTTVTGHGSSIEHSSTRHGSGNAGVSVSDLCHPSSPPPSLPLSLIVNSSDQPPARVSTINDLLHPSPDVSRPPSPRPSLHPDPTVSAPSHPTQVPLPVLPPGPLPFYSMQGPYGITPPTDTAAVYSNTHHHRLPGHGTSSTPVQQSIRHKKEIKRRTKTGCMTCRKRRIKCDEARPTCNNCKKSKRDCAGYPGFKPPPPLPITRPSHASSPLTPQSVDAGLPVANSADSSFSETEDAESAPATPRASAAALASSASPAAPTPEAATAGAAFAAGPLSSTPSPVRSLSTTPTQASWSAASRLPALSSSVSSLYSPMSSVPASTSGSCQPSTSPRNSDMHPPPPMASSGIIQKQKLKVEDLIGLGGPAPTPAQPPSAAAHETVDDITNVYYEIYVPGLSAFFETAWYNFKPMGNDNNPISILLENKPVMDLLAAFLTAVGRVQSTDPKHPEMTAASAQEPRVVWALASLVYTTPAAVNPPSDEPMPIDNVVEARNRVSVVDALLSGGSVRTNPCMRPPRSGDPHRIREHQFWWWLAEYLRLQDDPDAAPGSGSSSSSLAQMREQALAQMRNLLDGRENRDVIYAIATLRELAPRYGAAAGSDVAVVQQQLAMGRYPDESDPLNKYAVAAKFIRNEAQDRGGTTNVVRRLAQLGLKAYIQPGSNIRRP